MFDELDLINRCKQGNMAAFERLVSKYEKMVYNIAFRILSDYEMSYDASQEVFIKVYKNIDKYEGLSSFSTWIYRITYNTCIDIIRKTKNKELLSLDEHYESYMEFDPATNIDSPEEAFLQKESANEIQRAINCLSDEHKTAIVLRDIKGLSYSDIAEITDASIGTVKSRISRARNSLRKILEKNKELNKRNNV